MNIFSIAFLLFLILVACFSGKYFEMIEKGLDAGLKKSQGDKDDTKVK